MLEGALRSGSPLIGTRIRLSTCGAFSGMSERCLRAGKFFLLQGTVGSGGLSPLAGLSGWSAPRGFGEV